MVGGYHPDHLAEGIAVARRACVLARHIADENAFDLAGMAAGKFTVHLRISLP